MSDLRNCNKHVDCGCSHGWCHLCEVEEVRAQVSQLTAEREGANELLQDELGRRRQLGSEMEVAERRLSWAVAALEQARLCVFDDATAELADQACNQALGHIDAALDRIRRDADAPEEQRTAIKGPPTGHIEQIPCPKCKAVAYCTRCFPARCASCDFVDKKQHDPALGPPNPPRWCRRREWA